MTSDKEKYYGCKHCWDEKAHKAYEEKQSEMEKTIEKIIKLLDQKFSIRDGKTILEKVQKRLLRAQVELEMARDYDYFVVNDTVENAVNELRAIMCAEHCKPAERMDSVLNSK